MSILAGYLPDWITMGDIVIFAASATAMMALLTFWDALVIRDPIGARLRSFARVREGLKAGVTEPRRNRARGEIRKSSLTFMRLTVDKLRLMRGEQADRIAAKLSRAGWRSGDALTAYIFARAFVPAVTIGGALALMWFKHRLDLSPSLTYLVLGVGVVLGLFGTDLLVKNAGDNRIKKLTRALPDALDLMVICAEAGLSLEASIKRVGQEMASVSPEMSEEFLLTAIELNFLPDRARALQNLARRTDLPKLRALVNSLIQSERFGTPLANSLRVLSAEFRNERMMTAEEKAAKLPAIMTIPMIVFILPSLFIVIIGPVILHVLDTLHANNI
jgi:tight adherence protein C